MNVTVVRRSTMHYDKVQLLELEAAGWIARFIQDNAYVLQVRLRTVRMHTKCSRWMD